VLLPAQIRAVVVLMRYFRPRGALGFKCDGSKLRVDTGKEYWFLDAQGELLERRDKT